MNACKILTAGLKKAPHYLEVIDVQVAILLVLYFHGLKQ